MFTVRALALTLLAVLFAVPNPTTGISQSDTTPPPTPPLQVNVRNVLVNVVVTDKGGAAVSGLKKEDFELFENGARQSSAY